MTFINPFIHFNGNAEDAFHFYKSVFGGEFTILSRLKDFSGNENGMSEHEANKIMQIALPIGKHTALMGSDVPDFLGRVSENENRSKIFIGTETKVEADRIFLALSVGGTIEVPMAESPWGSYFGMFRDKYGIEWMVSHAPEV